MRENKGLIFGLAVFFIMLFGIIGFLAYRVYNAIDNQHAIDQLSIQAKEAREVSQTNNKYECGSIEDQEQNQARCIVEKRTKKQEADYLKILSDNNQIATVLHSSQTRTGFSDGIYGENNFAEQYNVKGEINPNTVYQYRMEFGDHVSDASLTKDEIAALGYFNGTFTVTEKEYATILNPHASYQTLYQAGLANEYSNGLLIGSYPQDNSSQVMVSNIVAQKICNDNTSCNKIDDLLNQEMDVELVGMLTDGSESAITASIEISGVYAGETMFNDIVLAYDGLNDSDVQLSSGLTNTTLVDSYLEVDSELEAEQTTNEEETSTIEEKAHQENQEMLSNASAGAKQADADYDQAKKIVQSRYDQINNQLDNITSVNSNAIAYDYHNDQTRTGFTDGIFGDTNFENQYVVSGTIEDDMVYRYYVDLKPVNQDNFTDAQISDIYQNQGDGIVGSGEYVALLNPQAKYSTLKLANLADGYDRGLLTGGYPADGSNQAMISYLFASNICDTRSDCDNVSDLVGTDYTIKLGGVDKAGIEKTITATLSISGIYYGSTFFNDIILAYDQLNQSENN